MCLTLATRTNVLTTDLDSWSIVSWLGSFGHVSDLSHRLHPVPTIAFLPISPGKDATCHMYTCLLGDVMRYRPRTFAIQSIIHCLRLQVQAPEDLGAVQSVSGQLAGQTSGRQACPGL